MKQNVSFSKRVRPPRAYWFWKNITWNKLASFSDHKNFENILQTGIPKHLQSFVKLYKGVCILNRGHAMHASDAKAKFPLEKNEIISIYKLFVKMPCIEMCTYFVCNWKVAFAKCHWSVEIEWCSNGSDGCAPVKVLFTFISWSKHLCNCFELVFDVDVNNGPASGIQARCVCVFFIPYEHNSNSKPYWTFFFAK